MPLAGESAERRIEPLVVELVPGPPQFLEFARSRFREVVLLREVVSQIVELPWLPRAMTLSLPNSSSDAFESRSDQRSGHGNRFEPVLSEGSTTASTNSGTARSSNTIRTCR